NIGGHAFFCNNRKRNRAEGLFIFNFKLTAFTVFLMANPDITTFISIEVSLQPIYYGFINTVGVRGFLRTIPLNLFAIQLKGMVEYNFSAVYFGQRQRQWQRRKGELRSVSGQ